MAGPIRDDEEEKPLDPAVERVRRRLVRFAAINLGILFLALMIVVGALVYKSMTVDGESADPSAAAAPPLADGSIAVPFGARILSQSFSGDRLALHVALPAGQGEAILIYSLAEGRVIANLPVRPE